MKIKTSLLALALLACVGSANASVIMIGDGISPLLMNGDIAIGDNSYVNTGFSIYSGTAVGRKATVINGGVAFGDGAYADSSGIPGVDGDKSSAFGINAHAENGAMAFGQDAFATNLFNTDFQRSIAIGTATVATNGSVSLGSYSSNNGRANAVSVGNSEISNRRWGGNAQAPIFRQIINVGAGTQDHDAVIVQQVLPAIGTISGSLGGGSTYNPMTGEFTAPTYNLSIGTYNNVGDALTAIDNKPTGPGGATNPHFNAKGTGNNDDAAQAGGDYSTSGGSNAKANEYGATSFGSMTNAGEAATVIGHQGNAEHADSTVVGAYGHATAACTTIGYASECDEDGTTSFGRDGEDRRLTHVADGQADTDAANMGQVRLVDTRVSQTQTVVAAQAANFGGGAFYDQATGAYSGPSYGFLSGAVYTDVGAALADLDGRVAALEELPPGGGTGTEGPQGPQGPQGPAGQDGQNGTDGQDGATGAEGPKGDKGDKGDTGAKGDKGDKGDAGRDGKDGAGKNLKGGSNIAVVDNADGTQTASLKDNVELSEKGSVKVGATTVDGSGVRIANGPSMTTNGIDAGSQRITNVSNGRIERGSMDAVNGGQLWELEDRWNDRWTEVNDRMDTIGAQSAALTAMMGAGSPLGLDIGEVAISAAPGFYGNKAAFAVGFSSRLSERVSMSGGFSIAPNGKAMGGVGFSWRLGK